MLLEINIWVGGDWRYPLHIQGSKPMTNFVGDFTISRCIISWRLQTILWKCSVPFCNLRSVLSVSLPSLLPTTHELKKRRHQFNHLLYEHTRCGTPSWGQIWPPVDAPIFVWIPVRIVYIHFEFPSARFPIICDIHIHRIHPIKTDEGLRYYRNLSIAHELFQIIEEPTHVETTEHQVKFLNLFRTTFPEKCFAKI